MTDKIQRGLQAEALKNNEIFREAFYKLEAEYFAIWRVARNVEAREDCHRCITLLSKLSGHIQSVVTTGEIAAADRKALEGKKGITWPIR